MLTATATKRVSALHLPSSFRGEVDEVKRDLIRWIGRGHTWMCYNGRGGEGGFRGCGCGVID